MGIFDFFRRRGDENAADSGTALKDRVTGMMAGHGDKVNQGLDKVGQVVDKKTGNKYTDQINAGVAKGKEMFSNQTGQRAAAAGEPSPGATPGPSPAPGQSASPGPSPEAPYPTTGTQGADNPAPQG